MFTRCDVHYNVIKMNEFTDGCAAQYKSRRCIGDLSCSLADFGFHLQRDYFETSHAKGEQDAAGLHVKQKVGQAVLRRTASINSARSMYQYLMQNFSQPAASSFTSRESSVQLKHCICFYVPSEGEGEGAVDRKRDGRKFREAKGIRKWHCVKSLAQQEKVLVRHRSCYCVSYIVEDEENCTNKAWLDNWKEVTICRDGSVATTKQAAEQPILDRDAASHIADLAAKGSTVAIAAADDPMYDFYLFKVTSEGVEKLESYRRPSTNGHLFTTATSLQRSLFFVPADSPYITSCLNVSTTATSLQRQCPLKRVLNCLNNLSTTATATHEKVKNGHEI